MHSEKDLQTVSDLQQVAEILDQRIYELKSGDTPLRSWVTISRLLLLRMITTVALRIP